MTDVAASSRPHLVVVSGQPGSGKTTLAHRVAKSIGCPAIVRDEIKEGMAHAHGPGFRPATSDPLTMRTYRLFFECLRVLLAGGVTVVAEAAFQHRLWLPGLEPVLDLAEVRIICCEAEAHTMVARRRARMTSEPTRSVHADSETLTVQRDWTRIQLDRPTLEVDTTDGYRPGLDEIAAFCRS